MRFKTLPPADVLRQLLDYDPDAGILRWKPRGVEWFEDSPRRGGVANVCSVWNARYAGTVAGMVGGNGYVRLKLLGGTWTAHRLIWKWVHGEEPEEIDHINRDKSDNRLGNLRNVSHGNNMMNKPLYPSNTSGHRHIHWHRGLNKWTVQLRVPGKGQRQVAWKATLEDAVDARNAAYERFGYEVYPEDA